MMDDYLNELNVFFDENIIPQIEVNEITFLEIAKQPHYENVVSNIYAFFLNPFEKHGFDDLFISSLKDLINEKISENKLNKKIILSDNFEIFREIGVEQKKRIDLLIYDEKNAVVIENKIYHELNNPLKTYYNSQIISKVNEENKIGIILSLWKQNTKDPYFINITHIEWLDTIIKSIDKTKHQVANNKYLVFLEDFHQNIKNLTNKMRKDEIEFYRNNVEKINKAVELKFALRDHIISEIERTCGLLSEKLIVDKIVFNKHNQKRLRYYRSKKHPNLAITIVFEELFTEKGEIYIVVEVQQQTIKLVQKHYDEIIKDLDGTLNPDFKTANKNYAHFAHISNCKPSPIEIEHLSHYIVEKIKANHILEIFNKIELFLDNQ